MKAKERLREFYAYLKREVDMTDPDTALHFRMAEAEDSGDDPTVNALLKQCPDPECGRCGVVVCGQPLHFHHDGCPSCCDI